MQKQVSTKVQTKPLQSKDIQKKIETNMNAETQEA